MFPVPYARDKVLPAVQVSLGEGQYQAVHFTVPGYLLGPYLQKVEVLFADMDEVILVASGVSMGGEGFIVLEWEGCEVNPLFLNILKHEWSDDVIDFCVYTRSEEVE